MDQPENQYPIISWIGKNISKLEMSLVLAFMLGMMFKIGGFGPARLFIGFGLTFLSIVYFLYAFVPVDPSGFADVFMRKIMAIGWAMVVVGIMFFYLGYSGYLHQLLAGLIALILSMAFLVVSGFKTGIWIKKAELIRSVVILMAGIYIFMSI